MMNYVWLILIVFSFFCAIATENTENLSNTIISSGTDAVNLCIKLSGIMLMWSGLVEVAEQSNLTKKLAKLLSPVLRILFPKLKDEKAKEYISMNITANLLGLGNASTPLGLKAMSRLQKTNGSPLVATDDMARFVVINSAAIHLVPTTVALLRSEYGSSSPMEILLPSLCTSFCALTVGVIMSGVLKRVFK
ncbi:MAG: nucleoside recognition domain-containing protein [Acutalibacteraceae bacterium]